jgi:hypothetical protein
MTVTTQQATQAIQSTLLPGDVINVDSRAPWWKFWFRYPYWQIRRHQRLIFGENSRWHDTHTMLHLGPAFGSHCTLSVEPVVAKYLPVESYCRSHITIYRYTKRPFTPDDILVMDQACHTMVATGYDVGQLLDMMINRVLGYPHTIHNRLFDFGGGRKVCSVGVRVAFEHLRHVLEAKSDFTLPKLFSSFKPGAPWGPYGQPTPEIAPSGVDVEATAPAHFANSEFFDDEFTRVAEFDNGAPLP